MCSPSAPDWSIHLALSFILYFFSFGVMGTLQLEDSLSFLEFFQEENKLLRRRQILGVKESVSKSDCVPAVSARVRQEGMRIRQIEV